MGKACNFAHADQELRERPDLSFSKLCFQFSATGACKQGESCTFAHGEHELQKLEEPVRGGAKKPAESKELPSPRSFHRMEPGFQSTSASSRQCPNSEQPQQL
eukprot:CAMPEP_0181541682 /NCGR_PEP_ID=MMETSP1110-20121109/77527_1 /TAXON_ID=174948 /ORGANISM="Symbiodinium sp., Strain CCMP421" /LENGTH=102 /DNA_ID=CAMNT_0023673361 /DNA_START=107 /DNA_END=415 /DNA_ORIENTATION=+